MCGRNSLDGTNIARFRCEKNDERDEKMEHKSNARINRNHFHIGSGRGRYSRVHLKFARDERLCASWNHRACGGLMNVRSLACIRTRNPLRDCTRPAMPPHCGYYGNQSISSLIKLKFIIFLCAHFNRIQLPHFANLSARKRTR